MKKLDNRGFLLVETLVVSTFTLTVLVILFIQFKNLVVNYNESYYYNTVEGIYNLNAVKKYVSQNQLEDNKLNDQLKSSAVPYLVIYNDGCKNTTLTGLTYCETMMKAGDFKTVLYTNSDIASLKDYVKNNDDSNISEKLTTFIKKLDSQTHKNRLIAEYENGTFASITFGVNNDNENPSPTIRETAAAQLKN